jgi:hypothetical protein
VTCPKKHARWLSSEALQRDDDDLSDDEKTLHVPKEVTDANVRCQGSLEIRKENDQWGVYAIRAFEKGEVVISSDLKDDNTKPTDKPCAHSIQIGWNKHILMNLPARYLNHSCDPNIAVVGLNEKGSYDFEALSDIGSDEELTFDYETTEYEIGAFSKCCCGSPNCRGHIRGYKHTGNEIREKYNEENISSYLLGGNPESG